MADGLCLDDLDLFGGELDDPLEELAQDIYHRIIEAPGSNLDDPARGFGLEGRLSGSGRSGTITSSMQHELEAELSKDDRVLTSRASITVTAPGEYAIDIQIVANEGVLGIKLAVDGSGVRRVA